MTQFARNLAAKLHKSFFGCFFLEKSNILFSTSFQIKRGLAPPHLFLHLSIAAAGDEKKRNDKKPDIIVVKNVAKAVVHKYTPFQFSKQAFFPASISFYDATQKMLKKRSVSFRNRPNFIQDKAHPHPKMRVY